MSSDGLSDIPVRPPVISDYNDPGSFVLAMRSPWFGLIADLHDIFLAVTVSYATSHGLKGLYFPVTTRTVTCPSALGSDSAPVPVKVSGVDTYLQDSMQFALEYGCRIAASGCYNIMPSFREAELDDSHLIQFTHSEAEIAGSLEDLMRYVDGYVKALSSAILDRMGDRLAKARGDISHLQRVADRTAAFEQLTFDDAVQIVGDTHGTVQHGGSWRTLTRSGERLLMKRVSEVLWVHHFDNLAVPFYQAFGDNDARTAKNADLYLGIGEVAGSGERHCHPDDLRKSMVMHDVNEAEYEWYVRMREVAPMQTSGFGMGVDRFFMWVLKHDDIRDMPLICRLDEPRAWPDAVIRP
jgi:asparaginyl-tRNA synthetase